MKLKGKLMLVLLAGLLAWSCDNDNVPLPVNCIEVRIIDDICGNAIVQVVSGAHFDIAQDSWTDSQGQVHRNVFSTRLTCADMERAPTDGSTFLINIVDEPDQQNCVVCLAIFADMPEVFHHFRMVENCDLSER